MTNIKKTQSGNSVYTTLSIKEVACAYFPEYKATSAIRCFRREFERDEVMTRKRLEAGFGPLKRFLLPREVEILVETWGEIEI